MICLYAADESLFEHNGLGILDNDLKKCQVEEELNNLYTLTALYPLGAKFGKSIRNGMIIKAPTPNGDQLFRIYQSKPSMGMLEIHAFHIFYDLAFNFVEDTNIVSKSGQAWLQQLSQNTQYSHPFTFFSDISTVAGSRVVRKNCVEILLNTSLDNSFVNRFGGEILRDNFNVYFNRSIGENRGFKIRHKKNLKGYTANIDDKSVITRIMPIGFDGLLLPEKYVDSPRISDYPFPRIGKVEVDVKAAVGENTDAKDAIPLNEAYTKMRALIKEQFGVIDVPTCSYEVDFVELSKTKEYADFQNLETVRIGDTVTVSHDEDGFYVEAKVIRYEYDSLAGRLLRIEAGQFESRSSNNSINQQRSIEQQLEDVKIETSNMVQVAANGKNTIYRGVDRPTNANVGDLWYEPLENSVVLKQWSGVDWELIPISDQNLGNVNVNNLSGNHIDVRRFRISSGDMDILYVNEAGEVILNAKRIQIDFTDVATKTDLQEIELTPGPQGAPGVGITSTSITYARSTSGNSAPTSGWTPSVPSVPPGEFLWTKTIWNYSDNTKETGYSVAKMGTNGQTPYVHWAYADNADGTGLTFIDNGQRYIGNYSDYTQEDSTDRTKYRWADRWAKIEAGNGNLLRWTTVSPENLKYFTKYNSTTVSIEQKEGRNAYKIAIASSVPDSNNGAFFNSNENPDGQGPTFNLYPNCRYTFTFSVWSSVSIPFNYNSLGHHQVIGRQNVSGDIVHQHRDASWSVSSIKQGEWQRVSYSFTAISLSYFRPFFWYLPAGIEIYIADMMLSDGNIELPWEPSHLDLVSSIETKADQALTQQQLNMLSEKAQQMQTELEAKVAMETLSDLERAYNAYVEANDKAVAKSQADLIEAGRRVDAMVETLGGLSKTKTFIDTYIKEANEGIIIGTKDNVSQIRITYDRISMYSAGKEVMYISQGVIHIDNGVFTKSLQIGRFRTEQHQTNLDINVCRYVG